VLLLLLLLQSSGDGDWRLATDCGCGERRDQTNRPTAPNRALTARHGKGFIRTLFSKQNMMKRTNKHV